MNQTTFDFNAAPVRVMQREGAPSVQVQTGWRRPVPTQLCMSLDVLERITHFSFELSDKFLAFVARFGVGDIRIEGLVAGKVIWKTPDQLAVTKALFNRDVLPEERWKRIAQQRFQDIWEVFTSTQPVEEVA